MSVAGLFDLAGRTALALDGTHPDRLVAAGGHPLGETRFDVTDGAAAAVSRASGDVDMLAMRSGRVASGPTALSP